MNIILSRNKLFYIPVILLWAVLGIMLLRFDKSTIHIYLNQFHSSFFDVFFKWTTFLGDGSFLALVAVVFLFFSVRKGLILGLGGVISGVFAQTLKKIVFPDVLRPKAFFSGKLDLYLVPGVEVHDFFSFPSGHTTTAFCLFFILSYFTEKQIVKLIFLLCALVAGYSRIYLSQHFLIDVYFGAILGTIAALIAIKILSNIHSVRLDKSIITIFKKQ